MHMQHGNSIIQYIIINCLIKKFIWFVYSQKNQSINSVQKKDRDNYSDRQYALG